MTAKEGQKIRAKDSLPSCIQCGWETMGRTLTDGTPPGQTERHLVRRDIAWVWPTTITQSGMKTKASPHAGSSPHP